MKKSIFVPSFQTYKAKFIFFLATLAAFIACNKSNDTITRPAQPTYAASEKKTDSITSAATFGKVYFLTEDDYDAVVAAAGGVPSDYQQLYLCDTSTLYTVRQIETGISDAFSGTWLPYVFPKDGHSHIFVLVQSECNRNVAKSIRRYAAIIVKLSPYQLQSDPHIIGAASTAIIFTHNLISSPTREN